MKVNKIGTRNMMVRFEGPIPTTTHIIVGQERIYICDTFLGSDSMQKVHDIIVKEGYDDKQIVIFNSHADWDHIWGNCYFDNSQIIGHKLTRKRMIEEGEENLEKFEEYVEGDVIITPPNLVFDSRLYFADDDVEFFHTPGHTKDSSSCYDHKDKVLFVGDNVESEIPYVNHLNFNIYISSLESYLEREWIALISGHDPIQYDDSLLKRNIEYLRKFKTWNLDVGAMSTPAFHVHLHSLGKLVDEILEKGVEDRVRMHYSKALERANALEKSEHIQISIDEISQLLTDT